VQQRAEMQDVPVVRKGNKLASAARNGLSVLTKCTVWFSFLCVAQYHFDWRRATRSSSSGMTASRMHSMLSYGFLAGYVLISSMTFTASVEFWLEGKAKSSKTAPSTALALTAKHERVKAFREDCIIPVLLSVMAVVSVAGIWIHWKDFATL
jgi:hypothetical protein